jgi:aspartate kinase
MMSDCVIRFGGSSLLKPTVLEAFARQITLEGKNQIVVVSAVPEILKTIEQGINILKDSEITSEEITKKITGFVTQILWDYYSTGTDNILKTELDSLRNLLKGIELTGDFSLMLKDQVISYAERISASILKLYLESRKIHSEIVYPEELGLTVTEEYGNASVLLDEPNRLAVHKSNGISLIPGSYGITKSGKTARVGKWSADYSAAALTRLVGANSLQLWEIDKEFRTSDAGFVTESQIIPRLTYTEASEWSYFSGQSIHPRVVEPLIDRHIPIHVYRLTDRGKELATVINSESFVSPNVVKSVVHTDEIAILKLNGPGVGFKPGILAKVTGAFQQAAINIRSVITSQVSINIILNKDDVERARAICRQLPLTSINEMIIEDQVSLIAVIGHGMQEHHGVSAKLFTAVAQHKINVLLSGSGASNLSSYLVVDQKDTRKAILEIHRIFFNS